MSSALSVANSRHKGWHKCIHIYTHAVSTQKNPVHPIHFEQNLLWSQIAVCRRIWALSYQATGGEADGTCWKPAWPKWTHSSNTVSKTSMTICCFQTNWADFEEPVDSGPSKNIPVSIIISIIPNSTRTIEVQPKFLHHRWKQCPAATRPRGAWFWDPL